MVEIDRLPRRGSKCSPGASENLCVAQILSDYAGRRIGESVDKQNSKDKVGLLTIPCQRSKSETMPEMPTVVRCQMSEHRTQNNRKVHMIKNIEVEEKVVVSQISETKVGSNNAHFP